MSADRLYGLPGSERLEADAASVWETEIDPLREDGDDRWTIEEWTVHPVQHHLPTAGALLDWAMEEVAEYGEIVEDAHEHFLAASLTDEVKAAAQSLIDLWASLVTFRHADQLVTTHVVTLGSDGEPLLDREPLYVRNHA